MEVGSVWGHGSYVAPDWTADFLHREAMFILDRWAGNEFGTDYEQLDGERQSQLTGRLAKFLRTNTYDSATGAVTIDPLRAEAFEPMSAIIPMSSPMAGPTMRFLSAP